MRKRIKRLTAQIQRHEEELQAIPEDVKRQCAVVQADGSKRALRVRDDLEHLYEELREATRHSQALRTLKEMIS